MPSKERSEEMFSRVRLMADGDPQWDLSDNDTAALRHVLAAAEAREATQPTAAEVIEAAEKSLRWIVEVATTTKSMENEAENAISAIARWKGAK